MGALGLQHPCGVILRICLASIRAANYVRLRRLGSSKLSSEHDKNTPNEHPSFMSKVPVATANGATKMWIVAVASVGGRKRKRWCEGTDAVQNPYWPPGSIAAGYRPPGEMRFFGVKPGNHRREAR